jgi:tetratricopeptide (TPR) repeat protein
LKIFISGVTSEFGDARDALASDLRARGHIVHVQSDFQQQPAMATLLGTLAAYIGECRAVICIAGRYSGAYPPERAAAGFSNVLPKGFKKASYTQWEYFLAQHGKLPTYVYIPNDHYRPDRYPAASDQADLQRAFVEFLKAEGIHYGSFSTAEELRIAVLRDAPEIAEPASLNPSTAKPIVLPYPSIGDLFKGRVGFMQRLHDSLTRVRGGRTAIVSQALYGLGGIGKTRTAVEYAWTHADDYNALLFVVAETPEALRRNLAALASSLVPQLDTTDDAARLAAVREWLKANPGWFLILDNVDTREALAEVERQLSGLIGGHVIVTSRLADFPGDIQPLELTALAVEDAAAFLLERTKGRRRAAPDDQATVRELAEELGRLALMLEQAAANIARRRLTFPQYLEQWRSKRGEALEWFDHTVTGYPRAVAVTWQTSVAQLTEGGRRLLERLAWLAPEKVPETLIDVPIPDIEGENLHDAYDDLAAYSLVARDAQGPFFLIHRLVQDVTHRSLSGEARQRRMVEALGWINAAFTGDPVDVRNWPTLDPLAPHVRTVAAHADAAGVPEPTARLMNQLGVLLNEKALHAEAEPLMRRALAIDEKSFGPDHPEVATRLNNLAQLLKATSRLVEAEPLMRRALAIDEKSLGPDHPNVAVRLSNLAGLLRDTDRLDDAEPLIRRALAIDEKNFGPEHPDVASDLNNLFALLRATDRLDEGEPLVRRALAIDEKNFGPDHPRLAIRLNNLAILLRQTSRLIEAEPLMRRALAIDEKNFGSDHPRVAIVLNNLAGLLQATSRLEEAEPLMRRHVAIFMEFTRRTGHRHPHLDAAFANYAHLLAAMGKNKEEIEASCAELLKPPL